MSQMLMAIFIAYSNSGVTSGKKCRRDLKMAAILKCQNIKHSFNLTSEMKRSSQIMQEKIFQGDDVIDDVTGQPQSRSSIFLYEWKNNIFRDNCRTNKDNIFKVHTYNWIVNTPLQTIVDWSADDVIGSSSQNFELQ